MKYKLAFQPTSHVVVTLIVVNTDRVMQDLCQPDTVYIYIVLDLDRGWETGTKLVLLHFTSSTQSGQRDSTLVLRRGGLNSLTT